MQRNKIPREVLDRLLDVDDDARTFTEAADKAEREVERLRSIANNSNWSDVKEHKAARDQLEATGPGGTRVPGPAIKNAEESARLAKNEQTILSACKIFIERLDDRIEFEDVSVSTDGHDLKTVHARLKEIDDLVREIETAPLPKGRAWWADYVDGLARAGEFEFSAGRVFWPMDMNANKRNLSGFSEHDANPLLLECLLRPEETVEKLIAIDERICSRKFPPAERPARLAQLNEEKLSLRHLECALIKRVRDGGRGQMVERDPSTPPQCVLGVKVRLPAQRPKLVELPVGELRTASVE